MRAANTQPAQEPWRRRLHTIIFEADTPAGKTFDIFLLVCILVSVVVVMLDSVGAIRARYGAQLVALEWVFTILFTIEYGLRLLSVRWPLAYARTFFGIVDLLAILPTYLSLLVPGAQYLLVVRVLRLLRIFRIFKLAEYLYEGRTLSRALLAARRKISVFLLTVVTVVIVVGALMYVIEGPERGFTSIPISVYWAVVTMTTVGYGDIAPQTSLGKFVAVAVMLLGYGIIAVPTGIVTLELSRASAPGVSTQACPSCGAEGHDADARFCKRCGSALEG
ncbi:MAG TPA: ion transporter [Chloroflexaceae bacterium]|nr:ion transporter [Chloroflexaceae bacterium]